MHRQCNALESTKDDELTARVGKAAGQGQKTEECDANKLN